MQHISPFSFIAWKEDEDSLVARTTDDSLGYISLLQVDSIEAEDLINYAKGEQGAKWQENLARSFPDYVAAIAAARGLPCFLTTTQAVVEYADLDTGEVLEATFKATPEAYNEAVRIEIARAEHDARQRSEEAAGGATAGAGDEDEFEDINTSEEQSAAAAAEHDAHTQKRRLLEMLATQIESAISCGSELGLTLDEVRDVFQSTLGGDYKVPATREECAEIAKKNHTLSEYVAESHNDAGAAAGGANCNQQ